MPEWNPYLTTDRGRVQAHAPGEVTVAMTESEACRRLLDYERLAAELARVRAQRGALAKALESISKSARYESRRLGASPGSCLSQIEADARAALDHCKEE